MASAEDRADLDVRRETLIHAGRSGGVALIGPEQHRRQGVPAARATHLFEGRAVADHPAYRRQRFPRQPYRNILDFLLRVLAAMPRLVSNAADTRR